MNLFEQVQDGYVDNAGVTIHYVAMGRGPLLILIHGFPEFWYSWRHQMPVLAEQFQVVAVDLRGYNLSDKPAGVEAYKMRHLVGDIVALIGHFGATQAVVVGHDWGGMVAWTLAMFHPELVERLVICNLPHPTALARALTHNPQQQQKRQKRQQVAAAIGHYFERYRLVPGISALLNELRDAGIIQAVVSNWPPSLKAFLEYHDLSQYFRVVVGSGEFGVAKPEPAIFLKALIS